MINDKKKLKSSEDFVDGVEVYAKWCDDEQETKCLLVQEGRRWYLLQDKHEGSAPSNMRGRKYGWTLGESWKPCTDSVCEIWGVGHIKPYIQVEAEETWRLFEEALDCVRVYGKSLDRCEDVKALSEKLMKLIK